MLLFTNCFIQGIEKSTKSIFVYYLYLYLLYFLYYNLAPFPRTYFPAVKALTLSAK